MRTGRWSARAIAEKYLARIDAIDRGRPARGDRDQPGRRSRSPTRLDAERKAGGPARAAARHPGADQGQHRHRRPHDDHRRIAGAGRRDAAARRVRRATRLRAAGAVILGKTNLSEWANFRSTHSTSGWSGRGGQTRNPYALDRNPVRLQFGIGRGRRGQPVRRRRSAPRPTARSSARRRLNGIVGIKPTVGLVSRAGIIPIAHSQDTAGPDGAHRAPTRPCCSARWPASTRDDAATATRRRARRQPDYTKFLDPDGLQAARASASRASSSASAPPWTG